MGMKAPNSEQNPVQIERRDESELKALRERVQLGTAQADSGQAVPADEVFSELRHRNAEATKQSG